LGEVDDLDALEEIEILNVVAHRRFLPRVDLAVACPFRRLPATLSPRRIPDLR
jgi:hypothetical protein